jgi:hypothetical protein
MATCCPNLREVTFEPSSVIVPENSWPRVIGMVSWVRGWGVIGANVGPPRYSWRSVPQMPTKAGAICGCLEGGFHIDRGECWKG